MQVEFIFFILQSLVLGHGSLTSSSVCRPGWHKYGNSCYLFVELAENWMKASEHCSILHGYLATIHTAAEDHMLQSYLSNHYGHVDNRLFWLGGSDIAKEGHWEWVVENPPTDFTYHNWKPHNPDGVGRGEYCMGLYRENDYKWADKSCEDKYYFICEYQSAVYSFNQPCHLPLQIK